MSGIHQQVAKAHANECQDKEIGQQLVVFEMRLQLRIKPNHGYIAQQSRNAIRSPVDHAQFACHIGVVHVAIVAISSEIKKPLVISEVVNPEWE